MDSINTKERNYRKALNIKRKIDGFWTYCKDNLFIPDIETLCLFLDITRETLRQWELQEDNKNLSDTVKKVKNEIFHHKKQMAMRGHLNATIFIFDAKNNHGYVDKVEHEYNSNTNITVTFNVPRIHHGIPIKAIDGSVITESDQQLSIDTTDTED